MMDDQSYQNASFMKAGLVGIVSVTFTVISLILGAAWCVCVYNPLNICMNK